MTRPLLPPKLIYGLVAVAVVVSACGFLTWGVDRMSTHAPKRVCEDRCRILANAIDEYRTSPMNTTKALPQTFGELRQPPWGGPSFLERGDYCLTDYWGKPFEIERRNNTNGEEYILVFTRAPDGTPISQFGIGPALRVEK